MTPTDSLTHVPADPSRRGAPLLRLRADERRMCLTAPRRCEFPRTRVARPREALARLTMFGWMTNATREAA
jgi:hypothetical protein